jgi:uncharacterized membrane protein YqiK
MSPDDVHKILQPLLWAGALAVACFLVAVLLLWRHGRRMKAEESREG